MHTRRVMELCGMCQFLSFALRLSLRQIRISAVQNVRQRVQEKSWMDYENTLLAENWCAQYKVTWLSKQFRLSLFLKTIILCSNLGPEFNWLVAYYYYLFYSNFTNVWNITSNRRFWRANKVSVIVRLMIYVLMYCNCITQFVLDCCRSNIEKPLWL